MQKKNTLYTVNRWNKPLFMSDKNLFVWGGQNGVQGNMQGLEGMVPHAPVTATGPASTLSYQLGNITPKGTGSLGLQAVNNVIAPNIQKVPVSNGGGGFGEKLGAGTMGGNLLNAGAGIVGGVLNKTIGGGRSSGTGKVFSSLGTTAGSIVGKFNPVLGAAVTIGSNILGGGIDALAGKKIDWKRYAQANSDISTLRNINKAVDLDDLSGPVATASTADIITGGPLSDADEQQAELEERMAEAKSYQERGQGNNAHNLIMDKINLAEANYSALGGPLDTSDMGAIEYDFMDRYLTNKEKQAQNKNASTGNLNRTLAFGGPMFNPFEMYGGFGSIDEFRDWQAKNTVHGGTTDQLPGTPLVMALGGVLQTHGGDFSDGLTIIGAGGTHEESPYDGVQMGVDGEGTPNLVEEGETVWNDYVFSNRILADEATKKMFHLPKKKDITFADISKKFEKEIAERPNDPISKAGFKAQMQALEEQQERQKQEMEAERAKEAFEALSPEEQVAVMENATQQEQMAQQAAQEQAVAEQQAMQQATPEELALAEQAQQQVEMSQGQVIPAEEGYAYGGNLYDEGGALAYLRKWHSDIDENNAKKLADLMEYMYKNTYKPDVGLGGVKFSTSPYYKDGSYTPDYDKIWRSLTANINNLNSARNLVKYFTDKVGIDYSSAYSIVRNVARGKSPKDTNTIREALNQDEKGLTNLRSSKKEPKTTTKQTPVSQSKTTWGRTPDGIKTRTLSNGTTQYLGNDGKYHLTEKGAKATFTTASASVPSPVVEESVENRRENRGVSTTRGTSGTSARSQSNGSPTAASKKEINVGPWNDGKDFAQHWQEYAAPGLDAFLTQLEEDYNNADSEEKKAEILGKGMEDFNNLQDSYYKYILPGRGQTSFTKDDNVWNHQTEWNRMKGNTGFWSESDDGSSINKIAKAIDLPHGHYTTDTPSGNGIDGYNGAQTSLRTMGTTEAGDASYYAPYAERFRKLGLNFSPYDNWSYGDDLSKKLYRLSPITATSDASKDAVGNGLVEGIDYMVPEEEEEDAVATASPEEDDFVDVDENGNPVTNRKIIPNHRADWLRYAGLFGPAVGLGMQALGIGKPDTSSLDAAISGAGNVHTAGYKPLGNYLTYRPLDIWFEQAKLDAQSRATDRNLMNTSGGNRGTAMAGLIANGLNSQLASGNLFRQAQEYNDAKKERVEAFNRGTNQFNAEAYNRTSQFNADARNRANQYSKQLALHATSQKMAADAGWNNSIYGNVAGLFRGLGDLGRENYQYNQMVDLLGTGALPGITEDKLVKAGLYRYAKEGGKIKKKKNKRGLTF